MAADKLSRSLTHAELLAEITAGSLHRGEIITISDYRTVHTIPNTTDTNTGDLEPLQVIAMSNNELKPEAYSVTFPDDIIYYCPDNDQTALPGCTKGYINRRIDTKQMNDLCFDFRNVKWRRWQIDVTTEDATGAVGNHNKFSLVKKTGTAEIYIKLDNVEAVAFTNTTSWKLFPFANLSYISWSGDGLYFTDENISVPLTALYEDYHFFANQDIYDSANNNIVQYAGFIQDINTVVFGLNFIGNTFTNIATNSIADNFMYNKIFGAFENNLVGSSCLWNTMQGLFGGNIVGKKVYNNHFLANFSGNVIGSNVSEIEGFSFNFIQEGFAWNMVSDLFAENLIGAFALSNQFGSNFKANQIGSYFQGNTILANCNFLTALNNIIGVDFTSATHLYLAYSRELFNRADGTAKLRYCNNSDVIIVVAANA